MNAEDSNDSVITGDGYIRVCEDMCETCIFRPGNLMDLRPGRVKGMVAEALGEDSYITCHSTLSRDVAAAICHGFWRSYALDSRFTRFALHFKRARMVPPTSMEDFQW